jgi:hypothetical protein
MPNTRHSDRRETFAYWPAHNEFTGKPLGMVTNISEEGIQLHSEDPFDKDQIIPLRLAPPANLTGAREILLTVQNVWCWPAVNPALYHAGFKIIRATPLARKALQKLKDAFSYPVPPNS